MIGEIVSVMVVHLIVCILTLCAVGVVTRRHKKKIYIADEDNINFAILLVVLTAFLAWCYFVFFLVFSWKIIPGIEKVLTGHFLSLFDDHFVYVCGVMSASLLAATATVDYLYRKAIR